MTKSIQLPPRNVPGCPGRMVMNAGGGCDPFSPQTEPNNPPEPKSKSKSN